jgi:large subunit ribosomal protein L15
MAKTITPEDLKPADGSTHKIKRVGRGRSSGRGKTSCRGHNGEGQRSGRSAKRGFEGGQMPGYRQMPKLKGFQCVNRLKGAELNVGRIDALKMKEITLAALKEAGKAHPGADVLRILGNGEIKSAVKIKAAYVSPSAKTKIEAAGGTVELV